MEQRYADKTQHAGHTPARASGQYHDERPWQSAVEEASSSLMNPTAARLVRESIVSKPAGGSSDILAFARCVHQVDSSLE
jgi:hypothetical protein